MFINVPENIAKRLEKLAEQEGSTVGDILETLLNRYVPDAPSRATLTELAQNALEAGLATDDTVDTAERSHEILAKEYKSE